MREKFGWNRALALLLATLLYGLFVAIYFAPQFGGDTLVQGDITQYRGMTQEILDTRKECGEDPQWTGSMFGGMPAYLINVDYPAQIIKRIGGAITGLISTPAAFIFFAMLAMWLMLVMMGINSYIAIVGGAAYGLSTYFMLIIGAGHLTKMWALVYAPPMMGAIYLALRSGRPLSYALVALFASLELGANHPQITYYFLLTAAAMWLSELYVAWRGKSIGVLMRRTLFVALAGVVALLSNLSPMWYTAQHTPDTMRGGSELAVVAEGSRTGLDIEYATRWSYGRLESLNMLIPNFVGRDSAQSFEVDGEVAHALKPYGVEELATRLPLYWASQPFTGGSTYLGAVAIFLALLGLLLVEGRDRWWTIAISLFMLLLAWGSNFMIFTKLMFDVLPAYNKFRTVSMALVVVEWVVPLMASYGLMRLWQGGCKEGVMRRVAWAAGLSGGVGVAMALFGGVLFDFGYRETVQMLVGYGFPDVGAESVARAMASERFAVMSSDGWRTAIYVALAVGVVCGYLRRYIGRWVMVAALGVLVVVDLTAVNLRYLNHDDFVAPRRASIVASDADRAIMADLGESGNREYRVINLAVSTFNDATTSYFHRSVGGYHGAKLSRYQDIIDCYLGSLSLDKAAQSPILDMLNTRYIITPSGVEQRQSPLGAAWFVGGVERVDGAREEVARIGEVDLGEVAVVARDQESAQGSFGRGEIAIEEYLPHYQRYRYNVEEDATAIFSEIYYDKGWRAFLDGEEIPYFRANYLLRGANLPAGEHIVEWRFRAPRWGVVEGITLTASIAIMLSFIVILIMKIYGTKSKS